MDKHIYELPWPDIRMSCSASKEHVIMSGPDISPVSIPAASSTSNDWYHPDFCSPLADFIVCSFDGIRFKCHKLFLQEASPVFRTMLTLPQPHSSSQLSVVEDCAARPPSIDLPESGKVLEILLKLIYPMNQPFIDTIFTLSQTLTAAEKYDMVGVISSLRLYLRDDKFLSTCPLHIYALACRFSFAQEVKLASKNSLTHDIHDPNLISVFQATGLKATDLFALMNLHHRRVNGMREFLEGDRFEGNAPDFTCVACDKKLNDITWPFLKASILKEMYRRPLGDTLFGPEFLRSSAIHSFINCKCDECNERVIYEKGKTLAMISEFLKSLPDSVELSIDASC